MMVQDVMTASVATIDADSTLAEAAVMMRDLDVGALPVVVPGGKKETMGMITDRDIVVRGIAAGLDPMKTKIDDIASMGVVCVHASDDIKEAVHLMEEKKLRRIVVLDEGERICGILSIGDIARHMQDHKIPAELLESVTSD